MEIFPLIDPFALRKDGTTPLEGNWDAGSFDIRARNLTADAMTQGSVLFAGASGLVSQDNANFNWLSQVFDINGSIDLDGVAGANGVAGTNALTVIDVLGGAGGTGTSGLGGTGGPINLVAGVGGSTDDGGQGGGGGNVTLTAGAGGTSSGDRGVGGQVFISAGAKGGGADAGIDGYIALNVSNGLFVGIGKVPTVAFDVSGVAHISSSIEVASALTLAAGSITDGSGSISFSNENISTTGKINNVYLGLHGTGDENYYLGNENTFSALQAGAGYNVAFGGDALKSLTTGDETVALGWQAGYTGTGFVYNVFIGYQAGYSVTANSVVAIGQLAMYNGTSSAHNVAIGRQAAEGDGGGFTGNDNIIIGSQAGKAVTTANKNVFIGRRAGYRATTAASSIYMGYKAGYNQTTNANLLILDNQDRGSAASEITDCLIYGVFNSTVSSQSIRFNVGSIGFCDVTPQAQQNHIVDADGTLADITTKFNTLLADLEGYGLLKVA